MGKNLKQYPPKAQETKRKAIAKTTLIDKEVNRKKQEEKHAN